MTTGLDRFFANGIDGDPLLGQIVHLDGAQWRLTLFMEGYAITGTVIGPYEYLTLLDKQLRKYDLEMGSTAGYIRHGLGTAEPALDDLARPDSATMPMWIHLADAAVARGDKSQRIGTWRGRTSAVTGWTLRSPAQAGS